MGYFKKIILGIGYVIVKDFKNIMKNLWVGIGVAFSVYQVVNNTIPELFPNLQFPSWIESITNYIPLYIIVVIGTVILKEKSIFTYEIKVDNESSIILVVGDFMKNLERFKNANCVFGVNDSYNCDMEKLSANSIHFQFIEKYFNGNFSEHETEVNEYIGTNYTPCEGEFSNIANRHYDAGTIGIAHFDSMDNGEKRVAFIIANSRSQANYKSYRMMDSTINYPKKIWEFITEQGTSSDSLLVPLIGTSQNTGQISKNKVAMEIIDSYFEYLHRGDVKDVIISIPEGDYINRKIDILMLRDYVKSKSYIYNQSK